MFKQYLNALRALLRIPTYLLMLLYYTMAFLAVGGGEIWAYVLGALAIAAWYINATSLNDLSDFEIDQVNLAGDSDRPLVTGALTRPQLEVVAASSSAIAVLLVAPFGWLALGLMTLLVILNVAYSLPPLRISARGVLALLLMPIGYVILTMVLGALAAEALPGPWLVALIIICYVQFVARISLKDYRDVKGDAEYGKRTFLLRHGSEAVVRLALACHLIAGVGGLVWLYLDSPSRAVGFVFLGTVAAAMLVQLRQAKQWATQRAWIGAYGRLVSGQVVILLLNVLVLSGAVTGIVPPAILLVLIVATFAWSAQAITRNLRT